MRITLGTPKARQGGAGQHIGMSRFGSRINCDIPVDSELNAGDNVPTSSTILACKIEVTSDE